jgi:hypothetical protein
MSNDMLTTKEALRVLEDRGIKAAYSTIAYWVRTGKFSGAVQEETPRGVVWYIPRYAVDLFEQPEMGRPVKEKDKSTEKKIA